MTKKQKEAIEGKDLDDLVLKCLVVTDRRGVVLSKGSSPVISSLSMEYKEGNRKITFNVNSSAMGNGSYFIEVKEGRKIVLKSKGNYTNAPYNSQAQKYEPGAWEKEIEKQYDKVK